MNATSVSRRQAENPLPLYQAAVLEHRSDGCSERQHWQQAADLLQQALAIREATCGKQDPGNARLLHKLGLAYLRSALPEQAASAFEIAENLLEANYHPGHGQLAPVLEHHADALLDQRKLSEAEPLLTRAKEIYAKTETMENSNTLRVMLKLARLYLALNKPEQTESTIDGAIKHVDTPLGPVAEFRYQLALAYMQEGKREKAQQMFQTCAEQFKQRHNYGRVADCLQHQANLAGSNQQHNEIANYRQRAATRPYPEEIFLATLMRA